MSCRAPLLAMFLLVPVGAIWTSCWSPRIAAQTNSVEIIESRQINLPEGQPLDLSPDGQWLAVWGGYDASDVLCIYAIVDLSAPHVCVEPFRTSFFDLPSITWSPDSRRLAFTEQFTSYTDPHGEEEEWPFDSDVWVMDVTTGDLTNLTEDGLTRQPDTESTDVTPKRKDMYPAWSPDGQSLVFARSAWRVEENGDVTTTGTILSLISASGGPAQPLITVADEGLAVNGVHWAPDGQRLLFTIDAPGSEASRNGLWEMSLLDKTLRQIAGISDTHGTLRLVDVSSRGNLALVAYGKGPAKGPALINIGTGVVGIVEPLTEPEQRSAFQITATFSPDGSKLLVASQTTNREDDSYLAPLSVWDVDSMTGEIVATYIGLVYSPKYLGGLSWASNDTIFVTEQGPTGWLLEVES